ncbi:MAG TPA: RtcB family protein [Pseudosphingobacterium sp.]|nr:RtcB family protein [Pseudosphingobacterium sp.]
MGKKLSGKDLINIGFPKNNSVNIALGQIQRYKKKDTKERILKEAREILIAPNNFIGHAIWGKVAEQLVSPVKVEMPALRANRVPFQIFGENEIDELAKRQIYDALKLPVAIRGALMPDAHAGYGLPIGGVLATDNAVIPYGVGVDIGCRMSMSIFDIPATYLKGRTFQLRNWLSEHTKFGMVETHKIKREHEVLDRPEFKEIPLLKSLHSKAYKQLGTSGGGNHFVEFGIVQLDQVRPEWKLGPGEYLALLSHSGSRGLGAGIARHYTYLATKQCPLPKQVQHLAWLDLNRHDGQEYWLAMHLAGDYAKACHDDIHQRMAKLLGVRSRITISNHHNFAWKETVDGRECVVHRKGATPAAAGVLGIIPGSMTAPGFIVEGLGNELSLHSASHGAGRLMSRGQCKSQITKGEMLAMLKNHDVELIGGAIDEAPMAYKDIHKVMQLQCELVQVLGTFLPKVVRMDK